MQQLKDGVFTAEVVQKMIDAFLVPVRDCWDNSNNSFRRFQSTINYKINSNSSYLKLPEIKN